MRRYLHKQDHHKNMLPLNLMLHTMTPTLTTINLSFFIKLQISCDYALQQCDDSGFPSYPLILIPSLLNRMVSLRCKIFLGCKVIRFYLTPLHFTSFKLNRILFSATTPVSSQSQYFKPRSIALQLKIFAFFSFSRGGGRILQDKIRANAHSQKYL